MISIQAVFLLLGATFWFIARDMNETTLLCVFYSAFVGVVWDTVSKTPGTEKLTWKHLLPPFMLVLLMLFSARLQMVRSSEVVLVTAISLIHFRAGILVFTRFFRPALPFLSMQLVLFVLPIVYLFQKNFGVVLDKTLWIKASIGLSALSVPLLFWIRKKFLKHHAN